MSSPASPVDRSPHSGNGCTNIALSGWASINLRRHQKMVSHAVPPHRRERAARAFDRPRRGAPAGPSRIGPKRARQLPERQLVRRADRSAPSTLHDQPASAAPCAWPSPQCRFGSPAAARPAPRPDPHGEGRDAGGDAGAPRPSRSGVPIASAHHPFADATVCAFAASRIASMLQILRPSPW